MRFYPFCVITDLDDASSDLELAYQDFNYADTYHIDVAIHNLNKAVKEYETALKEYRRLFNGSISNSDIRLSCKLFSILHGL